MNQPDQQRITVYFSGRVQGVGFRFRTSEVAQRFAVTGYVKNLVDGRVELIAEGTSAEVAAFLQSIRDTLRDNINDAAVNTSTASGEFSAFEIRR